MGEGSTNEIGQSLRLRAYAEDCLVDARLDLAANIRTTDHLNKAESVALRDVRLHSLVDGHVTEREAILIDVLELFAIEPVDRPGMSGQRIRTRAALITITLGPYRVEGHVHGPVAGDPFGQLTRRPPLVPLTEARII